MANYKMIQKGKTLLFIIILSCASKCSFISSYCSSVNGKLRILTHGNKERVFDVESEFSAGQPISEGQFGQVRSITTLSDLSPKIAVKKVTIDQSLLFPMQQQMLKLLNQELELMYALNNYDVSAKLHACAYSNNVYYIFQEQLWEDMSQSLSVSIKKVKAPQSFGLFMTMIKNFEIFHQIQIVHNDIKPKNIMLTFDGTALKAIDFGFAHYRNFAPTKNGSPRYLSPNRLRRGPPSTLDDLYAFVLSMAETLASSEQVFDKPTYNKETQTVGRSALPDECFWVFRNPDCTATIKNNLSSIFQTAGYGEYNWTPQLYEMNLTTLLVTIFDYDPIINVSLEHIFNKFRIIDKEYESLRLIEPATDRNNVIELQPEEALKEIGSLKDSRATISSEKPLTHSFYQENAIEFAEKRQSVNNELDITNPLEAGLEMQRELLTSTELVKKQAENFLQENKKEIEEAAKFAESQLMNPISDAVKPETVILNFNQRQLPIQQMPFQNFLRQPPQTFTTLPSRNPVIRNLINYPNQPQQLHEPAKHQQVGGNVITQTTFPYVLDAKNLPSFTQLKPGATYYTFGNGLPTKTILKYPTIIYSAHTKHLDNRYNTQTIKLEPTPHVVNQLKHQLI